MALVMLGDSGPLCLRESQSLCWVGDSNRKKGFVLELGVSQRIDDRFR